MARDAEMEGRGDEGVLERRAAGRRGEGMPAVHGEVPGGRFPPAVLGKHGVHGIRRQIAEG